MDKGEKMLDFIVIEPRSNKCAYGSKTRRFPRANISDNNLVVMTINLKLKKATHQERMKDMVHHGCSKM